MLYFIQLFPKIKYSTLPILIIVLFLHCSKLRNDLNNQQLTQSWMGDTAVLHSFKVQTTG